MSHKHNLTFARSGSVLVSGSGSDGADISFYDGHDFSLLAKVGLPSIQWTVSSLALSPDGTLLAYSTMDSAVGLLGLDLDAMCVEDGVLGEEEEAPRSALRPAPRFLIKTMELGDTRHNFAIYSVAWSASGDYLVAATGAHKLLVVDAHTGVVTERVPDAHSDDVNAVVFLDTQTHSNILVSGSDDASIKLWDRRCLSAGGMTRPSALVCELRGARAVQLKRRHREAVGCACAAGIRHPQPPPVPPV